MIESSPPAPAVKKPAWSGIGCAGVGLLSFVLFVIVQGVLQVVVLLRIHPDAWGILTRTAMAPAHVSTLIDKWLRDSFTAPYMFLYALFGDGGMIAIAVPLARSWLGATFEQLGFRRFVDVGQLWLGAGTGILLIVASGLVSAAQTHFVGPHPEKVAELLLSHHGTVSFILDLASVAVIAPVAEELLFRGIVFGGLVQRMPLAWAAVLSGAIFGIAHLDPWSFLPLATVGIGLALLYHRTGSLWPNIAAHATFNAIGLVAVYWFPQLAT